MKAISATTILIHLLGGVALLLWGLRMVRTGVMRAYGADLRRVIGHGLRNRASAFLAGLGVTAVLQSSTATALMTASFAERGLLATGAALAVMLGADVGTALVAQALSLRVDWISPVLLFIGVVGFLAGTTTRQRDLGRTLVGLGLMLLALRLIVEASTPLRNSPTVDMLLAGLGGERVIAVLIAAGLTWLAHSSLAVVLLVMSLASIGMLPAPLALALIVGANLGGAFPALAATWQGDAAARRVTLGNLVFRLTGSIVVLPFIEPAAQLLATLDADPARLVINFHLAFNVALAVAFIAFTGLIGRVLERKIVDAPGAEDPAKPRYLDPAALESPPLAIAAAARETLRMGDVLEGMLRDTLTVFQTDDRKLASEIIRRDDVVDRLHEAIKLYLTQVSREPLGEVDGKRAMDIIAFTTNLEHVGDIIDKNLMEMAVKKIKNRLHFSTEGFQEICTLHSEAMEHLQLAMSVFISGDITMARKLLSEKIEFRDRERQMTEQHLLRLRSGRAESIETSSLHLDILRDLKRINSHLTSVAYPILEAAGELSESRLRARKTVRARRAKAAAPGTEATNDAPPGEPQAAG